MTTQPSDEVPSELQGYRRVVSEPASAVDASADRPAKPPLPVQAEGIRIAKIVVTFTLLAPLVAGGALFVLEIFYALFSKADPNRVNYIGMGVIPMLVAIFALPWALVTSTLYACIAVWSGWRNVLVALAIMLSPMLLFYSGSKSYDSFWHSGLRNHVIALVAGTTIVCWILTRRWHSPNA